MGFQKRLNGGETADSINKFEKACRFDKPFLFIPQIVFSNFQDTAHEPPLFQ